MAGFNVIPASTCTATSAIDLNRNRPAQSRARGVLRHPSRRRRDHRPQQARRPAVDSLEPRSRQIRRHRAPPRARVHGIQARAQVVRRHAASPRSRHVGLARRRAVERRARRRPRALQGASLRASLPRARAGRSGSAEGHHPRAHLVRLSRWPAQTGRRRQVGPRRDHRLQGPRAIEGCGAAGVAAAHRDGSIRSGCTWKSSAIR